jgi:hypothetical protein
MSYPVGSAPHAIEIAKAEVGYVETPDNITKYGEAMKAQGLPWCGSFCNWVLKEAGVRVHSVVSTVKGAQVFQDSGRWSQTPKLGDLAFMDFPNDSVDRISHVGLVVGIKGNTVVTIEGNTSGSGSQRNGGMVMVKERTIGKEVVGFGSPKYVPYKGEFPTVDVVTEAHPAKGKKVKK